MTQEKFELKIITPENTIFSGNTDMVSLPSYEGEMCILKDHISFIGFLRPGLVKIYSKQAIENSYFVENGFVEFNDNSAVVLSSNIFNVKDINKETFKKLNEEVDLKLKSDDLTDHDRYLFNHKQNTLKEIETLI